MDDEKIIKLPTSLGLKVISILKDKIGFIPRKCENGLISCEFSDSELKLIDKLVFENPNIGDLIGIELLPNLKSLRVISKGNTAYTQDKYISSISDKDGFSISKCKNLTFLEIEGQFKLSYLDLSELKKLNALVLMKNFRLEELEGLDLLERLWQFDCIGNESLVQIKDLDKIILANKEMTDLNLDLLLFPDAIGFKKNMTFNGEIIKKFEVMNVSWQEILVNRNIKINNFAMINMHSIACQAIQDYVPMNCEPYVVVAGIEKYLADNVVYDYSSLKHGHSHVDSSINLGNHEVHIVSGPTGGANGAFNAFIHHTCVCEGYTRAMQYLLRLKGIKSHNVHNITGEDKLHMSSSKDDDIYETYKLPVDGYHSIICIDDVNHLYDDPCWNACMYQAGDQSMKWTLLTKDEISKDHTLSFIEKNISNNHLKVDRRYVEQAFQSVDFYRNLNKSKSL